jgi:hypothetical protein
MRVLVMPEHETITDEQVGRAIRKLAQACSPTSEKRAFTEERHQWYARAIVRAADAGKPARIRRASFRTETDHGDPSHTIEIMFEMIFGSEIGAVNTDQGMLEADNNLTISFDSGMAMAHFQDWIAGPGEDNYWDWMEHREDEFPDDAITVNFEHRGSTPNLITTRLRPSRSARAAAKKAAEPDESSFT